MFSIFLFAADSEPNSPITKPSAQLQYSIASRVERFTSAFLTHSFLKSFFHFCENPPPLQEIKEAENKNIIIVFFTILNVTN